MASRLEPREGTAIGACARRIFDVRDEAIVSIAQRSHDQKPTVSEVEIVFVVGSRLAHSDVTEHDRNRIGAGVEFARQPGSVPNSSGPLI